MAYEWVGTAAATVLGLAGIGATLVAGKYERSHAERMAQKRFEQELTMAREARQQERLADAYGRLLVVVERIGQWAQMVKPMWDTEPPQPDRPLPELDEQAEAEAVMNAFGSDQARQAFEAWRDVVRDILAAVHLVNLERDARSRNLDVDFDQPYRTLHNLRPAERKAREALARQVNKELRRGR